MDKLNSADQSRFDETIQEVGKILIVAMRELKIPNFIHGKYLAGKYYFTLKFDKHKANDNTEICKKAKHEVLKITHSWYTFCPDCGTRL